MGGRGVGVKEGDRDRMPERTVETGSVFSDRDYVTS